jgi:hypothetical protein
MNWKEFGKCLQESGHGLFKVISWHANGVTEESHEKTAVNVVDAKSKVQTEIPSNKSFENYIFADPFGWKWL